MASRSMGCVTASSGQRLPDTTFRPLMHQNPRSSELPVGPDNQEHGIQLRMNTRSFVQIESLLQIRGTIVLNDHARSLDLRGYSEI